MHEDILQGLEKRFKEALDTAQDAVSVEKVRAQFLGRSSGEITLMLKQIAELPLEDKQYYGPRVQRLKTLCGEAVERALSAHLTATDEVLDPTIPGGAPPVGSLHPLTHLWRDLEHIFSRMGFLVVDGPELESEYYNFEALNIPSWHPARDMQDTFYIDTPVGSPRFVLRTHTSPVQIRAMRTYGAPLQIVAPGKVFRFEATDASHDTTFHQVEGLVVGHGIGLTHLKGTIEAFLFALWGREIAVRLRPGYFPFTEPGFEIDMQCQICGGSGCPVCKHHGWVEFMGAGLVHPHVLRAGGIDPEHYTGFAFGFGLTRLALMKYKIPDVRMLLSNSLDMSHQLQGLI